MIKINSKKFLVFLLLCLGVFCLFSNKIFAAGLEVDYPEIKISGESIGVGGDLPGYARYVFLFLMAVGFFSVFISLIWAGVKYFLLGINVDARADAKDRAMGAVSGLLILSLTYLIITTINPQLKIFIIEPLPAAPTPPPPEKTPGVYFYNNAADCPDGKEQLISTSSMQSLGNDLKNKVAAVKMEQGQTSGYISILYDTENFTGKCQYVSHNQNCQAVMPSASSASIYKYSPGSFGGGVTFFRKSCFDLNASNCKGGQFNVSGAQIGKGYILYLPSQKFQNVPEQEQDCVKYDENGICRSRVPPSLNGENISSVKINGDYIVLFVYSAPNDERSGPWTYCQEFPTIDEANKKGPKQIKWESIRNKYFALPNYVLIIPIQRD